MSKIVLKGILTPLLVIFLTATAGGVAMPVSQDALSSQDNAIAGTPWRGKAGIRETVGEIMKRERSKLPVPGRQNRMIPFRTDPARRNNPQDPHSPRSSTTMPPEKAQSSAILEAAGLFTPQLVSAINFTGATLADTLAYPPDSMGAVGPTQFIVAVNGRIRSFDKSTGIADGVLNMDTDAFFQSVMTPPASNNFTSDPRIRYDRLSGRWFITMIDVPGKKGRQPNRVMIAVSDSSTVTNSTVWTFFYFEHDLVSPTGDTGDFADYPTLGIDANALYIGVNIFTSFGSFSNTTVFVVRKSSVLGAGPIVVTAFRDLIGSDGPFTPQGVDNYDPAATEGYFIGVSAVTYGTLILRRVSDPGGSPSISANIPITVNSTYQPLAVPQLGSSATLDALDDRLFAAHIRNGMLWTAHNIAVTGSGIGGSNGDRDGSRWYELTGVASPGTPSVYQSGTVYDSASSNPRFYWIPSIVVSGQGHAAMGFSTSGNNEHANAGTVDRLAGDAAGTMQTPALYTNSSTVYNPADGSTPHRWGDYSYTSLDPDDDMTMWTIQEFCNATNSYGVQVVKLLAPPPATPSSVAPSSINAGQASVNVTVAGISVSGSGFFDPGAGFAHHIAASVSGVTVNSVTYTDPTHVTLNLSTVGATGGARTITVTNPDGQSAVSASPILIVCSPIAVNPGTIPSAAYNTAYSQTFTASGGTGPYSFGLTGALPGGMNFSGATLSGSPLALGNFSFAIAATDANGCTGSGNYTITVGKAATATTITSDIPSPSAVGATVTVSYTVTSVAGTPTGTVTVGDGTISCGSDVATGSCSLTFPSTGTKTLTAQYSGNTYFDQSTSPPVSHTVTSGDPVRISETQVGYATIRDAYAAAADGNTIEMQAVDFTETLGFDRNIAVILDGGYNSGFTSNTGTTSISGSMTISSGTVTVGNIIIH
jgi:hypothetical protein